MENIDFGKIKKGLIKWFNYNGNEEMKLLLEDFESDKDEYIIAISEIDTAFELLESHGFFEENDREEFIESDNALFAVEDLMYYLDTYDLPRVYVVLLPVDLFYRALDFLTNKLEELGLLDEYYNLIY